jgi:hypothetical protein
MSATKVCTKCGVEKPVTEFHRAERMKDGYRSDCKLCHNSDQSRSRHPVGVWRGPTARLPRGFNL